MSGDLRLIGPAVGAWIVVVAVLLIPVGAGVIAVVIAALVATGGAVLARQGVRPQIAVTVFATCGVAAAAGMITLLRVAATETAPVRSVESKPTVVEEVTGDPQYFSSRPGARIPARLIMIDGRLQRPVAVDVVAESPPGDSVPGRRLEARVRVKPAPDGVADRLVAARLAVLGEIRTVGEEPVWQRWAGTVRERLRSTASQAMAPRSAGLFPGLVLGDTSQLDEGLRENFRSAGLTHLVAVSGSNFGIVCGAAVLLLRLFGASTRVTVVLGLLVMVGFVILVRPSDSVLRAAIMGGVGLAGALAARRAQALPALGAAIVVIMLVWPQMAVTPGFWLSVLATLGLVLWAAPIRAALMRKGVPEALAVLLAMTLAAQILTTPVVIAISGRLSLVSVLANVVVAPVVGVIALLGTAAAVLGGFGAAGGAASSLAELLVRATVPEMWWLVGVADALGGRSWSAPGARCS